MSRMHASYGRAWHCLDQAGLEQEPIHSHAALVRGVLAPAITRARLEWAGASQLRAVANNGLAICTALLTRQTALSVAPALGLRA